MAANTTITGNPITGVVKQPEIPPQLLDIAFSIEESSITNIDDLVAQAIFENFGVEPTSVDITSAILDEKGKRVYIDKDSIVVKTESTI